MPNYFIAVSATSPPCVCMAVCMALFVLPMPYLCSVTSAAHGQFRGIPRSEGARQTLGHTCRAPLWGLRCKGALPQPDPSGGVALFGSLAPGCLSSQLRCGSSGSRLRQQ